MFRVLVVDDDPVNVQLIAEVLGRDGARVLTSTDPVTVLDKAASERFDLAILDVRMPSLHGVDLLKKLKSRNPDLPVIMMTGFGSVDGAVEALGAGAADYLSKPMNIEALRVAVQRALSRVEVEPGSIPEDESEDAIIGRSPAMVEVYRTIARLAPGKSTVLLHGESGTGKEVVAREIHRHSPRREKPFVAIDCGALPETLLESELFGHVRGSFTGAIADKTGLFEDASGGTLFLDEIGNISAGLQAKLLRVLEEQQVRPVGSNHGRPIDVRIIAATNRDLEGGVREGSFREDLYYRLNVVALALPPLRERKEDLPILAQHLLKRTARELGRPPAGLSSDAVAVLSEYDWPGNVRQLAHVLERALVLTQGGAITAADLPLEIRVAGVPAKEELLADRPTLEQLKRRYIRQVLEETKGNISRSAAILGVDRRSLYRMLERYKIPREPESM
jgi:two-component system response regulator AtoC